MDDDIKLTLSKIAVKASQEDLDTPQHHQVDGGGNNNGLSGADQARRIVDRLGAKFFFKNGATLLHQCVEKPPAYVYVLAHSRVPVNIQNFDGDTALHLAVRAGNYDVTLALLQCSADINSRNKLGQTPCDIAEGPIRELLNRYKPGVVQIVLQGRWRMLQTFLKHTWCSVDTVVKEGQTLMQLSLSKSDKNPDVQHCCRILHDYRTTSDIIHAVLSEDLQQLKTLLGTTKGYFVNVRYRDKFGTTLLSHAIESNNLAIAQVLVDANCRVNRIRLREHDQVRATVPLCHKALQKGVSLEMIALIHSLQDSTERTEKDQSGNTMLLRAVEQGLSEEVIRWLIKADHGRCLKERNKEGFVPREVAAQKSRVDIIDVIDKYVSKRGRGFSHVYLPVHFYGLHNINLPNKQGQSNGDTNDEDQYRYYENQGVLIFEAAARGNLAEVEARNKSSYKDKNGFTALTRAIVFYQPEVVKYLCTSRPELKSSPDNCNRYPLHYACALPDDQMKTISKILLEREPEEIETRLDWVGRSPADYKNLRDTPEIHTMLFDARTLDAYGQRGQPLAALPPGAETGPPESEE